MNDPIPGSDATMFIQWKGTDVCMDFNCPCGTHGHYDGDFAYNLRCPGCGSTYEMGTQVRARLLGPNEHADIVRDLEADANPATRPPGPAVSRHPNDDIFHLLLRLHMASDPTPLDPAEDAAIEMFLNQEARARGFDNWIVAFHEL